MMRFVNFVVAVVVALTLISSASVSEARQQAVGGKVVHTRRAPVILHRMVPPQYGKHVYAGR